MPLMRAMLRVVMKNVVELLLFFPDVLDQVASIVTALPSSVCGGELSLAESGELSLAESGESTLMESVESTLMESVESTLVENGEDTNAEEVLQQTYKRMRALRKRIEKANQALRSLESKPSRLEDFVSIEQRQELIVRDAEKSHV